MIYWLLAAAIGSAMLTLPIYRRISRPAIAWFAVLLLLALALLLAALALVWGSGFLGSEPWYDRSPTRELALFFLMGLGMLARILSLAIEERRAYRSRNPDKPVPKIALDHWDLVYPFLSSAICFGALVDASGGRGFDLVLALFAFQNGFFWQTVLASAKP